MAHDDEWHVSIWRTPEGHLMLSTPNARLASLHVPDADPQTAHYEKAILHDLATLNIRPGTYSLDQITAILKETP